MLLIKHHIAQSPIHGVGVFADEDIRSGQLVWAFQDGIDKIIPLITFAGLPEIAKEHINRYAYSPPKSDIWILNGDAGSYINHSASPNLVEKSPWLTYAGRDIKAGEELTIDYRTICQFADNEPYTKPEAEGY